MSSIFSTLPLHPLTNKTKRNHLISSSSDPKEVQIRVCTSRTCRKQGSFETLETLSSITPPNISVTSCGCLSKCGSGPNIVFLPKGVFVSHCGTPARTAQVLAVALGRGDSDDAERNLSALAFRKRAEVVVDSGGFSEAQDLLSQAIDLKPSGGLHIIYKIRSSAKLAMGNNLGALEDAKEALAIAPKYPQAYVCQGDALLALEEFVAAENSYLMALQVDPSIRRSKSFQARVTKLQEMLAAANIMS